MECLFFYLSCLPLFFLSPGRIRHPVQLPRLGFRLLRHLSPVKCPLQGSHSPLFTSVFLLAFFSSVDSSLEVFSGDSDEGIGTLNRFFPLAYLMFISFYACYFMGYNPDLISSQFVLRDRTLLCEKVDIFTRGGLAFAKISFPMAWFRAVSGVARSVVRRNIARLPHLISRVGPVPRPPARGFRTGAPLCKPESTALIPRPVPLSRLSDSFLDGTSSVYLEELQRAWEADPSSVDESWDNFFRNFVGQAATSPGISGQTIQESMRLMLLLRAYQVNGHMKAKLDPLDLERREVPEDLDLGFYGFSEADLDREFFLGVWRMAGFLSENRPVQTLREILNRLEQAYCGNIGYEYMHVPDREKCNWLRDKIEMIKPLEYSRERREVILDRLIWSTEFENFLATKWTAAKRFGLEGGETLIPGMKEMFDRAADLGVESIVIGMSHRGRLNVLGNVVRKPLRQIFSEFSGGTKPVDGEVGLYTGTGDVKYHLGTSYDRPTRGGKRIHLSLVANPSHLEAVDPVVVGKTRAKQYYSNDIDRTKNMGVLIHGDGSFAGQGVVYETLHLSALPNYTTGGTIHIVINNQVAFTTDPRSGRSSQYCTDVAKALNAPIFHVNGDDMEAVVHVCELAAEWRQTLHSDVVVDIVCYRRFGHNEIDEPSFTQPKMYQVNHSLYILVST